MSTGKITYRKRAQQLIDYSGLRFGNITPTDIDGFIDYHGECFVIIEYKYGSKDLPTAQRSAFETLANNCTKPTLFVVAEHHVENTEQDIEAGTCKVRETYSPGIGWRKCKESTVKELVEAWLGFIAGYGCDTR